MGPFNACSVHDGSHIMIFGACILGLVLTCAAWED